MDGLDKLYDCFTVANLQIILITGKLIHMLKYISWHQYWSTIIALTMLYEFAILIIFYRKELMELAKGKAMIRAINAAKTIAPISSKEKILAERDSSAINESNAGTAFENSNLAPLAETLKLEITELLEGAEEKKFARQEILFGLQQIIKPFKELTNTSYQKDINNFITKECEARCATALSEEEIKTLWLD